MTRPDSNPAARADYGLDAPRVVRNLFAVSSIALLIWLIAVFVNHSHRVVLAKPLLALSGICLNLSVAFAGMGVWMIWEARIGKMRQRDRLIRIISWTGQEQVLDVGCGRGLLLIAAAKKLTSGKATGIDIWQSDDLTGNQAESTRENAVRENVSDRVIVQSADMRQMPFPNESFDVVLSRAAIHNLYNSADRTQAISEIARVMKPGGQALIDDIRHHRQYIRVFAEHGCTVVRSYGSRIVYVVLTLVTFGSLRPLTILVRKSGA